MMRFRLLAYFFLLCGVVYGSESDDAAFMRLNDHSKGQLIYAKRPSSKTENAIVDILFVPQSGSGRGSSHADLVMVFKRMDKENKRWICTALSSQVEVPCVPSEFEILPMTESIQDHELTTYAVYSLMTDTTKTRVVNNAMIFLLGWKGGNRSVAIRRFLAAENAFFKTVGTLISGARSSTKAIARQVALDSIDDALDDATELKNSLADIVNKGDFFAATCLYLRFKSHVVAYASGLGKSYGLEKRLSEMETWVIDEYSKARPAGNSWENEYRKMFPGVTGKWDVMTMPVRIGEMQSLAVESFKGFITTRETSSFCEFPQWGNGMLNVLMMLTGSNEDAALFGKDFESAMKRYSEFKEQLGELK